MKNTFYTSLAASFILISSSAWGKKLRSSMGEMEAGHPTSEAISEIKSEVALSEKTVSDDRMEIITQDPSQAKNITETIAALSAREVFVVVDQSGSMDAKDDNPTGKTGSSWTRWNSAEVAVEGIAETVMALDRDASVPIYFFHGASNAVEVVEAKSTKDVMRSFGSRVPSGDTPLDKALTRLYQDHLKSLLNASEPFTVVVLTDGAPNDQGAVRTFFKDLVRNHRLTEDGRESLAAFTFVRQGDDPGAKSFLKYLDDELKKEIGVDIIDTKADNFIFGTDASCASGDQGPINLLRAAVDD